jgi:hypothetical protein
MTISAGTLERDETEVLAHSNDVFSSWVGFSYGNTIFENTGMGVGAVTKGFVFPWYQPTWPLSIMNLCTQPKTLWGFGLEIDTHPTWV